MNTFDIKNKHAYYFKTYYIIFLFYFIFLEVDMDADVDIT